MRKLVLLSAIFTLFVMIFTSACNEADVTYQRYYSNGQDLYRIHCQNCHMKDGSGLGDLIPPLTDTLFLKKHRKNLTCFVTYGLKDTLNINGKEYTGIMPADKDLAPIDLAKVLTYITNSFGNKQGLYDVAEVQENLNKFCR